MSNQDAWICPKCGENCGSADQRVHHVRHNLCAAPGDSDTKRKPELAPHIKYIQEYNNWILDGSKGDPPAEASEGRFEVCPGCGWKGIDRGHPDYPCLYCRYLPTPVPPPEGSLLTFEDRFWAKVDKTDDCWLWTGAINQSGYGTLSLGSRSEGTIGAHRASYILNVGTIPEGLTLDHLCRVRHCVRPEHLEPVTADENKRRGHGPVAEKARQTHCIHGHEFDEDNTIIRTNGTRRCRACQTKRS